MEVTNRFKGLDLVNRVPKELWTKVPNSVQEATNKTIPKKKKCEKVKWLSEEALQIAEERRAAKSKGEREGYINTKCRLSENSKERQEGLFQRTVQRKQRGKQGKT